MFDSFILEIVYKCHEELRLSIPQWNLLSRVVFRIYSSGADTTNRPEPVFAHGDTLILTFENSFSFDSFARLSLQFQAGNTAYFATAQAFGTEITSHAIFNSTPVVRAVPSS